MPTLSFKIDTKEQRTFINNWFADLVQSRGDLDRKGDALKYLMEQYDHAFISIRHGDIPETVEATIQQADCQYLRYEDYKEGKETKTGFVCYEFFSKKKKPSPLGTGHELILRRCSLCKAGKIDYIEQQVQKQLRKKNIKGLLDLRDILINLQIEGGIAQIFICKANLLEKKTLVVSTNGTHLPCPLEPDNPEVNVKHYCYTQITPWTMEPPCQYLIDPFVKVRVEPPEEAKEIIEQIALEYLDDETPDAPPKDIESEVIEPKEDEKNV